jgi:hypothetical protein
LGEKGPKLIKVNMFSGSEKTGTPSQKHVLRHLSLSLSLPPFTISQFLYTTFLPLLYSTNTNFFLEQEYTSSFAHAFYNDELA